MASKNKNKNKDQVTHLAKPRSSAIQFAAKTILVKVGRPCTLFHVDEKLLQENSPFFAKALGKQWREGQRRVVELPAEDPEDFNVWLNWLYRRGVYLDIGEGETRKSGDTVYGYIDAYALGDLLMDTDFKDAVCDAFMVQVCTPAEEDKIWLPHETARMHLYAKTAPGATLRKLLAFHMAQLPDSSLLSDDDEPAFILDLAKFKMEQKDSPDVDNVIRAAADCQFHEHGAEKECYRKKYGEISILKCYR